MNTARTMPGLTEAELDAQIDARLEAARDAALMQMLERARQRGQQCPPCTGDCNQGRQCPARLHAQVTADARASEVPDRWLAIGLVAAVLVSATLGVATRMGWW